MHVIWYKISMASIKITAFVFFLLLPGLPAFSQTDQDPLQSFHIGRNLERQGRMDEAILYYNEAIRISYNMIHLNTANRDSFTALVWSLQRLQRYPEVIAWGTRGLDLFADEYRIVHTMGAAYFFLNNHDESLRFMQRYVHSLPRGAQASVAYFFIGEIFRLRRQFHRADIAYSTAVHLEPNAALWWFRLGTVREAVGDYLHAINAYERALALNPNHQQAREGLIRSQRLAGLGN